MSVDPNLFAGLASLVTAIGGAVAAWFGSRSKVRLDDTAQLQRKLDRAEAELKEKERTWEEALAHARTAHSAHIDELQIRHDADIARLEGRIDTLLEQLDTRDRQLTKLDRLVLVMRDYIGKLSRVVLDLGGVVPDRPREMD